MGCTLGEGREVGMHVGQHHHAGHRVHPHHRLRPLLDAQLPELLPRVAVVVLRRLVPVVVTPLVTPRDAGFRAEPVSNKTIASHARTKPSHTRRISSNTRYDIIPYQ
eukprot:828691-Pyramimonas_sp.AAC.1